MNFSNLHQIILAPIITEKSLSAQNEGKYYFWVDKKASKYQIEKTFQEVFSIKPLMVNTLKVKGHNKMDWKKRRPITKPDRKKAIITVAKGQKIELLQLKNK